MVRSDPLSPVCAVGAIVFKKKAVLLVQRGKPPGVGQWSIPGGVVQLGETLETALTRELREETHLEVRPVAVAKVFDRILSDSEGQVIYHYVIVDYVCEAPDDEPRAGSDAAAVKYVSLERLNEFDLTEGLAEVILSAYETWSKGVGG